MAQPLRDPQELEIQVGLYQELLGQIQMYENQERQLSFLVEELKEAQKHLEKADKEIYLTIGSVMIQTTKKEALSELTDKIELYSTRLESLKKYKEQLKQKVEELKKNIEKQIGSQTNREP